MLQVETLPQSMVDIKTIVLKPQLDRGTIKSMGEKVKLQLFSKFGFKPKSEDIKLLASEEYFEPYFILGGKYVLDYCKRHLIEAEVDKKTTRLFVAGQEFNSKESETKTRRRVVQMTGEEHVHHERQGYYILDRMNREIPPERLPLSPFVECEKESDLNYLFKRLNISDEIQIAFLKTKIAQRPADVAEIMREIFDITDRTIAYYPMYLLTFENSKNRKEATVTIDGITGETTMNGLRSIAANTILTTRKVMESQIVPPVAREKFQAKPIPVVISHASESEVTLSPKEDQTSEHQPPQPIECREDHAENVIATVSAISEHEEEAAFKEARLAPTQAAEHIGDEVRNEPVIDIFTSEENSQVSQKEEEMIESESPQLIICEEIHSEPVAEHIPYAPKIAEETSQKDSDVIQPTQPKKPTSLEQEQTGSVHIPPPDTTYDTLNAPKEDTIQYSKPDENASTLLGFPARILGEVIEIAGNVTTIDGDVEIPSGTNINKDLVVKGSLRIGDNCRGHAKLKSLKDITIGADTIIDGDIISEGRIFVGSRSLINGVVEASGVFEIEKGAVVETICAQSSPAQ